MLVLAGSFACEASVPQHAVLGRQTVFENTVGLAANDSNQAWRRCKWPRIEDGGLGFMFPSPFKGDVQTVFPKRTTACHRAHGSGRLEMGLFSTDFNMDRIRLDKNQRPRLSSVYEKVTGFLFRIALGGRVESLRVRVQGRSNREIAKGNLQSLSVEFGQVRGPIFQARRGTLQGENLAIGYRPVIACLFPLLLLTGLLSPLLLTLITLVAYSVSTPRTACLGYAVEVSESDLMGCLVLKTLLKLSLDTIMKTSVLGQALSAASGDVSGALSSATAFEVKGITLENRRLLFDAQAVLPDESLFSFSLRTSVQAAEEGISFVNPEIRVSPGWPLPDFWLPVISGVVVSLGEWNRIQRIVPTAGSAELQGTLLLGTADLQAPPPPVPLKALPPYK